MPRDTLDTDEWDVGDSAELYGLHRWGAKYFTIRGDGHLAICPPEVGEGEEILPVSIAEIVGEAATHGVSPPFLLRVPHILENRIASLHEAFRQEIERTGYTAPYHGVFPIKANQQRQVIEEVATFGARYQFGFEAGSRAELIIALAHIRSASSLIVCNGYKDQEFLQLALLSRKFGFRTVIVLETPAELVHLMDACTALDVTPSIGLRIKLSTEGQGYWAESGGDQSPFGMNVIQSLELIGAMRENGLLAHLEMLHFHQGSQIQRLSAIRSAVTEAARIYNGFVAEGAPMGLFNVGGGLAVDYDGSGSPSGASTDYSFSDYARTIVETTQQIFDEAGTPHPALVSESGRAIVAPYSILVVNTLDVNRFHGKQETLEESDDQPDPIASLRLLADEIEVENLVRCYEDAVYYRNEIRTLFALGTISIRERAQGEQFYWHVIEEIRNKMDALSPIPPVLEELRPMLSDQYYGNFSVFKSLADSWAVQQLFPVVPLTRLDERPTREAIITDTTCDCDGKIKRYIDPFDERHTVLLHEVVDDEPYYFGVFLVGAYQETLGDLHNLFGDTHAVTVAVENGALSISQEIPGDMVCDVLRYVEYRPEDLLDHLRQSIRITDDGGSDRAGDETREQFFDLFRSILNGYTYCSQSVSVPRPSNRRSAPLMADKPNQNRDGRKAPVRAFVEHHFRHFNAATLVDAAAAYEGHLQAGGKMFVTIAGAMSTAELGLSLAEMIRRGKIHGICCTGANLEEDLFNLVAHEQYLRIPNYRELSGSDEKDLLDRQLNRVTDTCIPEHEAMRRIETAFRDRWCDADGKGERYFPHEFAYQVLASDALQKSFEIDPADSWLVAAAENKLPMFVPGWEDSTLGNMYAAACIEGTVKNVHTVRTGIEYMSRLAGWYLETAPSSPLGFFQIGGGIAGDFPICVVPMLEQDLGRTDVPLWSYFCQISDSTTSYGSYSGAVPNEKITWGKLPVDCPKFIIESDATIVAPLVFAYVLGW